MVLRKVIFVRHGESQGNAKQVYTGWGATPLSVRGEQEAVEAGLAIKASGVKFDTVFTSVLGRAVKTCELVCNTSGNDSVPMIRNWRLNARHSGALQGLRPEEAVTQFGEAKVQLWRSSYDILPACVDESDARHPCNDPLYADVPRSILPAGGESLKHVVERVVPYWREHIVPRVQKGESVLVVAHKNSFRALWQYIERIPDEDAIDSSMAPASAPLVFEFDDLGENGMLFKTKYVMNFASVNASLGGDNMLGKLYTLRHAETVNNARGIDNGWEDTALTMKGEEQALEAGMCLKKQGVKVDLIFTSVLQRAIKTAEIACMASNNAFAVPVAKSWRLNARHSGALHGMMQTEALEKFGDSVAEFRTSKCAPPALLERSDPRHPANDPLYADVTPGELPSGESYDLMAERVLPFWTDTIMPHIAAGKSVLVVAHRNPLKAIVEHLGGASEVGKWDAHVRSTLPFVHAFGACSQTGKPIVMAKYSLSSFAPQHSPSLKMVGKAVFIRHGESECNLAEAYTGWEDSGLTPKGEKQAVEAGRYLAAESWKFSVVFTSVLSRAVESVERITKESGNTSAPVVKSWRLNARHPGVLQGLTKPEAVKKYGKEKVNLWRGSYDVMPECVAEDDPRHPANNPLYAGLAGELPPGGESLARVVDRMVPFWREHVEPRIRAGEQVLVVGHKNSLKALFMYLEDTSSEHDMYDVRPVSTTAPLVFEFGDPGITGTTSSRLTIVKKYWVKHTEAEALKRSKCSDGTFHK